MDETITRRCLTIAQYMLTNRCTLRQAAKAHGVCKSSVHKDMTVRLPQISPALSREVTELLQYNKAVRHLRGGEATRLRFLSQ